MKEYTENQSIFLAHVREKDKEEQSLWDHLKETSELCGRFAAAIGMREFGELAGILHDLGKATGTFDRYIRSATGFLDPDVDQYVDAEKLKGKIDHSSAGAQFIFRNFNKKNAPDLYAAQILSMVIASHHSGLMDCLTPDGSDKYTQRMLKADESTRYHEAVSNLEETIKEKVDTLIKDEKLVETLKTCMKAMFEKNESVDTICFKTGLLVRFLFSCLIDADRLNTAGFESPKKNLLRNYGEYRPWEELIDKLDRKIKTLKMRNEIDVVRQEISGECFAASQKERGLYQLTVPTGGGKTLSSLRFALNHAALHGMDRILYIIPYTSIIDQNAQVAREIFEEKLEWGGYTDSIVLEHHSNLTPEEESTRQKLLAENWDAPVVFTTMVQLLEALFGHGTRSARRMHQLANAVLIFDEIQTLPVHCIHLFNVAVKFLVKTCGSTVVLCSATQPLLDRITPYSRSLEITPEQQIIKNTDHLYKILKRVEVIDLTDRKKFTEEETAELAFNELELSGSVLIIVNTKKSAKNLFEEMQKRKQSKKNNVRIYHLSTLMCPAHRMQVLRDIKENLDSVPLICVSTQLIEAGVDIDFGTVIRYMAGLDSIAQAAGRCNRNGLRQKAGKVIVVNPCGENLDRLKEIKVGKESTARILDEFRENPERYDCDRIGLQAMEQYYGYYFFDRAGCMNYPVPKTSVVGRDDNLFNLLSVNDQSLNEYRRQNNNKNPELALRQAFESAAKAFRAIDSQSRGVIVPYGEEGEEIIQELCAAFDIEREHTLLKKAQRYSINLFPHMFEMLVQSGAVYEVQKGAGIFYLCKEYYDENFGLSTAAAREMDFLNC